MTQATSALQEFTEWAATLTAADIPDEIMTQAQWCVQDLLGVSVAAFGDEAISRLIAAERTLDDSRQARVLVRGDRFSVPVAARINAFAASLTELADNVAVHANESNIPMALAHGEHHGASGEDLLVAIVVGAEAARRLHDVYYDTKKPERDFPVGVPSALNTFGSSFAAARLLDSGPEVMLDTANVALNMVASALEISVLTGSTLKPMFFGGWPASAGYTAATYASQGLTAASDSLESPTGGWLHGAAQSWDLGEFTRDLGSRWELARPDRKRHASCGFSHAALDGVLELSQSLGAVEEIDRIEVGLFPFGAKTVGGPAEGITTSNGAKFNLRYLIASALRSGGVITLEDTDEAVISTRLADPAFAAVMDKVTVTPDPEITLANRFAADVSVVLDGGERRELFVTDARGKGANQLSKAEIDDKYTGLAAPVLGDARAEEVRRTVDDLRALPNVAALVDLLVVD